MSKPSVFQFESMQHFVREMLLWKKSNEVSFSIREATKKLPRCSPTLVSLVIQGNRKLTPDRARDFSHVLELDARERKFFLLKVREENGLECAGTQEAFLESGWLPKNEAPEYQGGAKKVTKFVERQKDNSFLAHWLHPYIKDMSRLKAFVPDVNIIFNLLKGIASKHQIEHSLKLLFFTGFLRKTVEGKVVENLDVTESSDGIPALKIRRFHKKALEIASQKIENVPLEFRETQTILLALNRNSLDVLKQKIKDWSEEVTTFAELNSTDDEMLYQMIFNLSPIVGADTSVKSQSQRSSHDF